MHLCIIDGGQLVPVSALGCQPDAGPNPSCHLGFFLWQGQHMLRCCCLSQVRMWRPVVSIISTDDLGLFFCCWLTVFQDNLLGIRCKKIWHKVCSSQSILSSCTNYFLSAFSDIFVTSAVSMWTSYGSMSKFDRYVSFSIHWPKLTCFWQTFSFYSNGLFSLYK